VGDAWFERLCAAWASPGRYYHTLDHLAAVLSWLDDPADMRAPWVVRLAAWFHDAVYDPRAADNEDRSAELARAGCAAMAWSVQRGEEVARLVLLTRTHRTEPDDVDGQQLLDADLAVLGSAPDVYDRYAEAIRREYAWVADDTFRQGRARVLQSFLDRPRLFFRPAMFDRFETSARQNLRRELQTLLGKEGHSP